MSWFQSQVVDFFALKTYSIEGFFGLIISLPLFWGLFCFISL